tara:strand:- start:72 stop:998 length:927 start_codon:yes stop_codon:yes gene_type:complete
MKILISGAHGDIGISICRILKKKYSYSTIDGTDINLKGPGDYFFNKIIKVNKTVNNKFLKQIRFIYSKYDLIIPTTEVEMSFIAKNKKIFEKFPLLINSKKILDIFLDKYKTFEFLKKNKLNAPNFCIPLEKIKKFNRQFFLKKKLGHGNRNYKLIKSKKDFSKLKNLKKNEWIAQEFLGSNFNEYTCAIIKIGNFKDTIILNRRLNGGYTYFSEVIKNKNIDSILFKIAEKINLNGCLNVQLKISKKRIVIFEINPRISSTVMMRHKMGFKDCLLWINYFLNKKTPKKRAKIRKTKMIKIFDEIFLK